MAARDVFGTSDMGNRHDSPSDMMHNTAVHNTVDNIMLQYVVHIVHILAPSRSIPAEQASFAILWIVQSQHVARWKSTLTPIVHNSSNIHHTSSLQRRSWLHREP